MQTKNLLLLAALTTGATLAPLTFAPSAEAVTVWKWEYTQTTAGDVNTGDGSGTFTTEDTPIGGPFLITAITGSFANLGEITLLAPGTIEGNDNLVSSGGTLDFNGIGFKRADNSGPNYNLFASLNPLNPEYQIFAGNNQQNNSIGTFSATPVPFESDALPLAGATVIFGGAMWFKRRRAQAKVNLEFLTADQEKSA